jgi:hypothetical protein
MIAGYIFRNLLRYFLLVAKMKLVDEASKRGTLVGTAAMSFRRLVGIPAVMSSSSALGKKEALWRPGF